MSVVAKGLDGVVVADTRKSMVDGENGRLYYAGYKIQDLAENSNFEEVAFLLLNDRLPTQSEYDEFKKKLISQMPVDPSVISMMHLMPKNTHPMAALRTAVSFLGTLDPKAEDASPEDNYRKAIELTAKVTTLTAAWARLREGKEPIAPRSDLSLSGNFVYMFKGTEPTQTETDAIDVYLILLADHGFNASTFTARVVTSTDGDLYSAIVAAIGSLKGPKHGGANEAAMKMFMEIGSIEAVDRFFTEEVKGKGRKIMGIGHRVYKATDPRGAVMKRHAEALAKNSGNSTWYDIAEKLESLTLKDSYFIERKLYSNVDYYSSIVLYTLGIAPDMMTLLFTIARTPGWAAQVMEQLTDNRLIRPEANYTGTLDEPWVPIEKRK